MALRFSEDLLNALQAGGSLKQIMSNCFTKVYTQAQASDADQAVVGTLLGTWSDGGGTPTREVLSVGSVDLTGGASGSVDTLTVNSIEIMGSATAFDTSLAQTAANVVQKINDNPKNLLFTAYVSNTDKINIQAKPGLGALPNGWVVASGVTTITKTDANMAGGVTALNGLLWGDSADGTLSKKSSQEWETVPVATGVAGSFRIEAAVADGGGAGPGTAGARIYRIDGSIGTSGAEWNTSNLTYTTGIRRAIESFSITLPTE